MSARSFSPSKIFSLVRFKLPGFLQKCKDSMTLILLQKIGQNKGWEQRNYVGIIC